MIVARAFFVSCEFGTTHALGETIKVDLKCKEVRGALHGFWLPSSPRKDEAALFRSFRFGPGMREDCFDKSLARWYWEDPLYTLSSPCGPISNGASPLLDLITWPLATLLYPCSGLARRWLLLMPRLDGTSFNRVEELEAD